MAILAAGLQELELPFRATLELRYRRNLPDDTIAAVAGFDERVIQRQRQRALVWLAQRPAIRGPDAIETIEKNLRALSPGAWAGEAEPSGAAPEPPEEAPEPEPPAAAPQPPAAAPLEPPPAADAGPAGGPRVSIPPPGTPTAEKPAPALPSPRPFPSPASPSRRARPQVSPRTAIGLLALLAAIVILVLVVSSGGPDEDGAGAPAPAVPSKDSAGKGKKGSDQSAQSDEANAGDPAGGASAAMEPVPGADLGDGAVEVQLSGAGAQPEIAIKLSGLPEPGAENEYRGWLYDSVIDSRTLGRARSGDGTITAALPEDWQRYRFLDLSLQERGSTVHSGESIARVPVSDLPAP